MEMEIVELVTPHLVKYLQHLFLGEEMPGHIQMDSPVRESRAVVYNGTSDPPAGNELHESLLPVKSPGPSCRIDPYALARDHKFITLLSGAAISDRIHAHLRKPAVILRRRGSASGVIPSMKHRLGRDRYQCGNIIVRAGTGHHATETGNQGKCLFHDHSNLTSTSPYISHSDPSERIFCPANVKLRIVRLVILCWLASI